MVRVARYKAVWDYLVVLVKQKLTGDLIATYLVELYAVDSASLERAPTEPQIVARVLEALREHAMLE